MTQETKDLISSPSVKRALFMILFFIIGRFSAILVFFISIIQFIYTIIYKNPNEQLLNFSKLLSSFIKDIADYLMMHTEEKPWPLGEWKK